LKFTTNQNFDELKTDLFSERVSAASKCGCGTTPNKCNGGPSKNFSHADIESDYITIHNIYK